MEKNISPVDNNENTRVDHLTYEQAFHELEELVTLLEGSEQDLDTALALYERGQRLAHYCAGLLDQAELRIQQISDEKLVDFEGDIS